MTIKIDAEAVNNLAGHLGAPNDHINQSRFRVVAALALDPSVLMRADIQQRIWHAAGTLSNVQGRINQLRSVTGYCAARYAGAEAALRGGVNSGVAGRQGERPWWEAALTWLPLGGLVGAILDNDPSAIATDLTSAANDGIGIGLQALQAYLKSNPDAATNAFLHWAETDVGPQVADGAIDWLGVAAGGVVAGLAAGAMEFITDTADSNNMARRAGKSVGVGAAVGVCTAAGMIAGTVLLGPGLGTFVGGALGGFLGNAALSTDTGKQIVDFAGSAGEWTANVAAPAVGKAVGSAAHAVADVAVGAAKAVTDCAGGLVSGFAHAFGF